MCIVSDRDAEIINVVRIRVELPASPAYAGISRQRCCPGPGLRHFVQFTWAGDMHPLSRRPTTDAGDAGSSPGTHACPPGLRSPPGLGAHSSAQPTTLQLFAA